MAAASNSKFNEANLAVLKGLIGNGSIENMTTAAIQSQWSQFFGHIENRIFSSRISRLRTELGKSKGKRDTSKKILSLFFFPRFSCLTFAYLVFKSKAKSDVMPPIPKPKSTLILDSVLDDSVSNISVEINSRAVPEDRSVTENDFVVEISLP